MNNWSKYKLSDCIIPYQEQASINALKDYKLIKIKLYHKGAELREVKKGNALGSKQFIAKKGQFIISKIDARNGAMGIVPQTLDQSVVTSDFLLFDFNKCIIEANFFKYYTQLPSFNEACVKCSEGSTNRVRLKIDKFLDIPILLPSLDEQRIFVEKTEKINQLINHVQLIKLEQKKEITNLLFSKYTDLIKDAQWQPMLKIAPIIRREVNIQEKQLYSELGIRSFGKGTFHKPSLTGFEVGTKTLYQVKGGDLIFSNVFAWEGAIAVAKDDDNDRYGSHRFISCVANEEKVLAEYLCYHFLTEKGLVDINKASPGGAGRNKTLGLEKLMRIEVPVPSIELQNSFIALLHKFKVLEENHKSVEQESAQLIPSLLNKAFKEEYLQSETQLTPLNAVRLQVIEDNAYLKRKSLAAYIINQSLDDPRFGNTKFEKLLHLSDYIAIKRNLNQNYMQQAAGPYDAPFTNLFFEQTDKDKWFIRKKKGIQNIFEAGQNHSQSLLGSDCFSSEELENVDRIISYFKNHNYEQPEIISTLYAVWNNRIINEQPITDDLLKEDFLKWDSNKIKYKDRLDAALQWMKTEGLIPDGWGKTI